MNSVNLTGRLTKDIELRYTTGDKPMAIANFVLAVYRDEDNTDFIKCIAYGKQAETAEKYLKKGSMAGVSGSIKTGSFEKDGVKTYTTDVSVNRIDFLSSKSESNNQDTNKVANVVQGYQAIDDDIPF